MENQKNQGMIVRVNKGGLVIVRDDPSGNYYPFTFDKIQGYLGETADELNLRIGQGVHFHLQDGKITEVDLHVANADRKAVNQ